MFWLVGVVNMSIWYKGSSSEMRKCCDHQRIVVIRQIRQSFFPSKVFYCFLLFT